MNRYEFIEKLRAALAGKATQSTINDNIRYYEEYMDTEIRKGKTEEAVLRELGDPRLLAKTIVEANKQAGSVCGFGEVYSDTVDFEEEKERGRTNVYVNGKEYNVPKWAVILAVVLVAALVISIVGALLSILLPIVLPLILVIMAVKIIAVLARK